MGDETCSRQEVEAVRTKFKDFGKKMEMRVCGNACERDVYAGGWCSVVRVSMRACRSRG